jgi:chromate reductase, NAD(P)H dehydrogenase (quinone)
MRILAISGSLREASNSTALLRALREEAPEGVTVEIWSRLKEIPPYDQDDDVVPGPTAVDAFRQLVREVDAVFFATPEYNSSVPGALKNALDWASRPFPDNVLRDKPAAVIGASTGLFGAVWAQAEVRKVLKTSGAHVLESELPVGMADMAFDEEGGLADPGLAERLHDLVSDLAREVAAPVEQAA